MILRNILFVVVGFEIAWIKTLTIFKSISFIHAWHRHSNNGFGPVDRYLGGLTFMGRNHLMFSQRNAAKAENLVHPALLLFGGDRDAPGNEFLADQWVMTLGDLQYQTEKDLNSTRNEICPSLLEPSKTNDTPFDWSCASFADVNSANPCRWEDVAFMAWCLKQYDSFTSPF